MAEIHFTYLPNGAPGSISDPARASTATPDYADFNRNFPPSMVSPKVRALTIDGKSPGQKGCLLE